MGTKGADRANISLNGKQKADIEQLLRAGQAVQVDPKGFSMYPMLVPGRDEAIIEPINQKGLKRGDVVLYRREGTASTGFQSKDSSCVQEEQGSGILVLHRVWKVREDGIYMVGDNQSEIEGPLGAWQIKGMLAAFIRKGKYISVDNLLYRMASHLWLCLLPWRTPCKRLAAAVKRMFLSR